MAESSFQSDGAHRMRLNVSAQVNDEVVSRFLVVVEVEAGMEQLVSKIQRTLKRGGINATVERILNCMRAILPHDEFLGDMLRDGEEIVVVLRSQDGQLLRNSVSSSPPRAPLQAADLSGGPASPVALPTRSVSSAGHLRIELIAPAADEQSEEETEQTILPQPTFATYPPPPSVLPGALGSLRAIPGPTEDLEVDCMPHDVVQVDHPCDPIQPATYDNDWLVESLTPQLREFVLQNFQEQFITEPKYVSSIGKFVGPKFYEKSGSFISIFMRPQALLGSDPSNTMPVHYNITKHDLLRFHREAEMQIKKAQKHLEWFNAAMNGLQGLLQKGMSETDHISDMLPHSYESVDEVEGAMMEVERPLFPKIDGANPIIIIDTSGPVMTNHLTFIKASLKRALFAHIGNKTSFQLIRFAAAGGEPRLWMKGMVAPTDEAISAAEVWIDNLAAVHSARLTHALRYAVAHQDCDNIYIISSAGSIDKNDHDAVLTGIRQFNTREVRIDTVAIEPSHLGELLLRRIAESNHGDMMVKSFNECAAKQGDAGGGWTSWRTDLVNQKSKELTENFKKPKMSIGSQVRIIEVMQGEEKKKEESWREEWKCAQRLLSTANAKSSKKQGTVMGDRDMVKELERKVARTHKVRKGGGFAYKTEVLDLGLERLFEHQSAVPWTANSDTAASGPKVPCAGAGYARSAKLPPRQEALPEALKESSGELTKQRVRPRSAGMASQRGQSRQQFPNAVLPPSNPWTPMMSAPSASGATRRNPHGYRKHELSGPLPALVGANGGANVRTASADRAAGDRATTPKSSARRRPRTPDSSRGTEAKARPPAAPPQQAEPPPKAVAPLGPAQLTRRWSF